MITILLALSDPHTKSKYERIYDKYADSLYRIAKSILKDEHLAQDVLQECLLKIFLRIEHIDDIDSSKTKAYITAIAKTTAIDFYRKEKRVEYVTESEEISLYDIACNFNVEEILANAELSKNLSGYLNELSFTDKNIIMLKYLYSYDDREIAEMTGITHGNVRIRLMRAKQKLAKLISKGTGGDIYGFLR